MSKKYKEMMTKNQFQTLYQQRFSYETNKKKQSNFTHNELSNRMRLRREN